MSTLTDRLRAAVLPRSASRAESTAAALETEGVADLLGGAWCSSHGHPFLIVDRRYSGGYRHGRVSILDSLPPDSGVWPRLPLLAGRPGEPNAGQGIHPGRLLFLDLETTGIAGGAGTYAFLVGMGWFEGAAFRVRQFFLSSFGAERAILAAVSLLAEDAAGLVTFNGKSFDVPLIDTRFALHRLPTPFSGLAHVDMLHVARRFWRPSDDGTTVRDEDAGRQGCRLVDLEHTVCGHARQGDVPGFEIPARYFHFVRSGDARPLAAVLEHNRLDLISLALLTARASQLLEEGHDGTASAREALGLGFVYERAGLVAEARAAYAYASGVVGLHGQAGAAGFADATDMLTKAEALRAYAVLARRERHFDEAAVAWQCALDLRRCPSQIAREAAEALAVHHEHRQRDLDRARRFALQSLEYGSTIRRTHAAQHRLARLDRKLGRPSVEAVLF